MATHDDEVALRLIRDTDVPATNPLGRAFEFGLQDTKQVIVPGTRRADGAFVFDFSLHVKPGKDPARPVFTGRFASGPADDRFVYLSWRALEASQGHHINRLKARLGTIDWELVRAAQASGGRLTADMSGWRPHDTRKSVRWELG